MHAAQLRSDHTDDTLNFLLSRYDHVHHGDSVNSYNVIVFSNPDLQKVGRSCVAGDKNRQCFSLPCCRHVEAMSCRDNVESSVKVSSGSTPS